MPSEDEETREARFFRDNPEIKQKILTDVRFQLWCSQLGQPIPEYPVIAYVIDGDVIVDEDQAMFHWGYNHGFISTDDDID